MPDGREIIGGQGVFALVEGRLAADVGRIGDADDGEEGSATGVASHREVKRKDNAEAQLESRQVDCVDGCEKPELAGLNLCLTAIDEELDCIDVATVVGGEEHYGLCDLIEFADSAKRSAAGRVHQSDPRSSCSLVRGLCQGSRR